MAGPWEQFQSAQGDGPWSKFGDSAPAVEQKKEKKEEGIGDWIANTFGPNGNLRGSAIGGAMQGAADPVVGGVQLIANALGFGDTVNKGIESKEKEYQTARAESGRDGFDAARLAGNVAITAPASGVGAGAASLMGRIGTGAAQGAGFAALNPVVNGGDNYWADKAKEASIGAVAGGAMAPVAGALGRIISPKANSADVKLLQSEGVRLTPGQVIGGGVAKAEEKLQSVPFLGDAISEARSRGVEDFNRAALSRAGVAVEETGESGIAAAKKALGSRYDEIIPKLQLDTSNPALVQKIGSLRGMAQSLPEREAKMFDDVIVREIDNRLAPNGVLSGQNLKDALAAIRKKGADFSRSNDAYQADLGQAFKQLHKELMGDMMATNGANGQALKAVDTSYANYKRAERAGASVGNAGGDFTPAQLYSAVKALDRSKDKTQFSTGNALMQDLAGAGKRVMGSSVPDSGTAGRMMMGGGVLGAGLYNPMIPISAAAGSVAYTPAIQNAIVKALSREGGAKSQIIANKLRELLPMVASQSAVAN